MSQSASTVTSSMSLGVKLAICLVAFFLVGLGVGVILLRQNTSTPTTETTNQVYVKVQYAGQWQGAYGDPTAFVSWNGYGDSTVTLTRPIGSAGTIWIIVANAQKMDGSTNTLTVKITKTDGTILKEASTTTPYGVVQIGYMFEGNTGSAYTPQTFTFMKTEELKVTGITWGTNYADLTASNTGAQALTITGAKVDDLTVTAMYTGPSGSSNGTAIGTGYSLDKGQSVTLRIYKPSGSWTSAIKYNFEILTKSGNQYPYTATKP